MRLQRSNQSAYEVGIAYNVGLGSCFPSENGGFRKLCVTGHGLKSVGHLPTCFSSLMPSVSPL